MMQASLAKAAGLHVGTVRRAEAGRPLSAETAQALCAVFGMPPSGLSLDQGSPSASSPTMPDEAPSRPVSITPGRTPRWIVIAKWVGFCAAGLATMGFIGFEVAAWTAGDPAWFRLHQAGAQTCLAVIATVVFLNRLASTWRMGWAAMLAVGVAAMVWPTVQVIASMDVTAHDIDSIMLDYSHERAVIELRDALDPAWDDSEARWMSLRNLMGKIGVTADYVATPGALAWHDKRKSECHDLYLHAERYPRDTCEPSLDRLQLPLPKLLWKSVVGGSFVPDEFRHVSVDDVVGGEGYAEARALYAEEADPDGLAGKDGMSRRERGLAKARAIAASRKDGKGVGG